MKLIMVDLDGTLCDTKRANYYAYSEALAQFGYDMDYSYYCQYCNGRHYRDFLSRLSISDEAELRQIHDAKKRAYGKYLSAIRLNEALVGLLTLCRNRCKLALITTASKENTASIMREFGLVDLFDLVLTGDEVTNTKPAPDGYLAAMRHFDAKPEECVIFEDSEVGIQAAENAGIRPFVVVGYN